MKFKILFFLVIISFNAKAQNYLNIGKENPGDVTVKHDGTLDIESITLRKYFSIFSNEVGKTHRRLTFNTNDGDNSFIYNYDKPADSFHTINIGGSNSLSKGITILGNGNVGIGVAKPEHYRLEVLGKIKSDQLYSNWLGVYSNASGKANTRFTINTNSGDYSNLYYVNKDNETFHTINIGGSNSLSNGITILGNGHVGIGTATTGGNMLAVKGIIAAREIKVETKEWADFVFNSNYKLKKLDEVEEYIKTNNHLPDIPSEQEVIQEGIALGEMDARLLQKIEELTLYMIEQNKRTNALLHKVEQLENENKELRSNIEEIRSN